MLEINIISENALCCTIAKPADITHQQKWWAFADAAEQLPEVQEVVVGMNNVTLFLPYGSDLNAASARLKTLWKRTKVAQYQGRHIEIPVIYGGAFGEDLAAVAQFHHTDIKTIVAQHTAPVYTVFMMGFQPGFPYLGGLPEALHTPRHATPRTLVPAGSVGIGGAQTGIYPFASPGGWQIIGHTETPLFRPNHPQPTLLQAGDTVQFIAQKIEK